jgi:ssDNA-binding Zn-finger/Zn-ribbon topoisomerase 1
MPYKIIFTCGDCGYPLDIIEGRGKGLYHVTVSKIHRKYGGKCPRCGRELQKRPKRIEFKTSKEYEEHMNVEVSIGTKLLTVRIPVWMYEAMMDLIRKGEFKTKTEFIIRAITKLLEGYKTHEVH